MLQSGLPEEIDDGEPLARFIFQSNHLGRDAVKPGAFLPSPRDRETSVFRHGLEPVNALWALGSLAGEQRGPAKGVAVLSAGAVRAVALVVDSAEPPPRHAVIRGWPWDDPDPQLLKSRQKELALALSSAAGPPLLAP